MVLKYFKKSESTYKFIKYYFILFLIINVKIVNGLYYYKSFGKLGKN